MFKRFKKMKAKTKVLAVITTLAGIVLLIMFGWMMINNQNLKPYDSSKEKKSEFVKLNVVAANEFNTEKRNSYFEILTLDKNDKPVLTLFTTTNKKTIEKLKTMKRGDKISITAKTISDKSTYKHEKLIRELKEDFPRFTVGYYFVKEVSVFDIYFMPVLVIISAIACLFAAFKTKPVFKRIAEYEEQYAHLDDMEAERVFSKEFEVVQGNLVFLNAQARVIDMKTIKSVKLTRQYVNGFNSLLHLDFTLHSNETLKVSVPKLKKAKLEELIQFLDEKNLLV